MAFTYSYNDVCAAASAQYTRSLDQTVLEYAMNNAIKKMWLAYDWRGTIVELPPFWLVPGEQDYGVPLYSVPSDFYGLREAYVVQVNGNNPGRGPLMSVVENLQRSTMPGVPDSICFRPSIMGFRVHPAPSFGMASPNWLIDGTYKTRPCRWSRDMMGSRLLWDDEYFDTFLQAYVWAAFRLSGQRREATEQEAVFRLTLAEATQSENLELGEPAVHPDTPLGVNRNGMVGTGAGWGVWR